MITNGAMNTNDFLFPQYGGYGLPFYTLGCFMLCTIPLTLIAFPSTSFDGDQTQKHGGMLRLLKIPSVGVLCLVIVVVSNSWGFMDPTLEPHLREVSKKIESEKITYSCRDSMSCYN